MSERPGLLRVAHFFHRLDDRAVPRLVVAVATEMADAGAAVTLLATDATEDARRSLPASISLEVLPIVADRTTFAVPRLARFLRSRRPDVLFAHGNGPNRAALLARLLGRAGTRVVVVEHNHYSTYVSPSGGGYRHVWLRDVLTGRLYARADCVAGVAPDVVADLRDRFGGEEWSTAVLPDPGRDLAEIAHLAAAPVDHPWLRGADRPRVVCSVANVIPRKGQHVLVEALPLVRARVGDVRLLLVGRLDNPRYHRELERTALRLGVREAVDFVRFRPNPLPYMAASDAFALASFNEGCPRVISEAMACGTPVVAADCPSGPAFQLEGGKAGLLVPMGDPLATADALAAVLTDAGLARELVARGRARARDFTPRSVAARYCRVARDCLHASPRRAAPPRD